MKQVRDLTTPAMVGIFLGLVSSPKPAMSQGGRWEREVRSYIKRASETFSAKGYVAVSQDLIGSLNVTESSSFQITLQAGISYILAGVCDDDCEDLHLALYASNGYEVDASKTSGNVPVIRITPSETVNYRVKTEMARCRMNPCWYGLAVFKKQSLPPRRGS